MRTWVGKLLSRAAILAILVFIYVLSVTQLRDTLGLLLPPNLLDLQEVIFYVLALVLFALAWVPDVATTLIHRRRQVMEYVPPHRGYFRVEPYTEAEGVSSYGRADDTHQIVLRWISNASLPLLYLTGRSGCGKSSLISAWLKPKLEAKGWIVCVRRGFQDPLQAAAAGISEPGLLWQKPPTSEDPIAQLRRARTRAKQMRRRILIVVDQFEEFLILHNKEAVSRSCRRLRMLSEEAADGLTILLVFRSDYEHIVDAIDLPRMHQSENWYDVGAFNRGDAIQFMRGGFPDIDEGLLNRLMRGLEEVEGTPGLYRPIALNMGGLVLFTDAGRLAQSPERLIQRYIRDAIRTPEIAELAPMILETMITEGGTKTPNVALGKLAKEARRPVPEVRRCMNRLAVLSLVKALDDECEHWEICHDFIASILSQVLRRTGRLIWPSVRRMLAPTIAAFATLAIAIPAAVYSQRGQSVSEVDFAKARLSELGCFDAGMASGYSDEGRSFSLAGTTYCRLDGQSDEVPMDTLVQYLETALEGEALISIDLSSIRANDIEQIERFEELRSLSIRLADDADAASITSFNELRSLYLGGSDIGDLSALSNLDNLEILSLIGTAVSDLEALSNLERLRVLDLRDTDVVSLSGIDGLGALWRLRLDDTNVADLSPLAGLESLEELSLANTKVVDLSPLSELSNLSSLDLTGTMVVDLAAVSGLVNLRSLELNHTGVTDLRPITSLEKLKRLSIYCVRAILEPLKSLRSLESLHVDEEVYQKAMDTVRIRIWGHYTCR